jgi:hypothetical protein
MMNETAVVDQGSAAAQRAGWRSAHVCQNRDFGQEATCRSKPGGGDMVEVKSDIEKFETTLALGKMGANFRKSSPNTKEPSALSVQDCDWDPRVAAGRDAMWFLIETLLFLIVVASNLYWRWSGNWYLAVIIAVIVAVIVARLIYWALSARAELILRKDWLGRR